MLERATACLKSGAARESVRCAQHAPRSRRMLHSTFWTHGAGDLDLPPWAVSMFPMPSDLPLKHDRVQTRQSERRENPAGESANGPPEGVFLDFLYPPQALAYLHRAGAKQQLQRWEKRNIRRLPEGFILASRGYSSSSYEPFKVEHEEPEQEQELEQETEGRGNKEVALKESQDEYDNFNDVVAFSENVKQAMEKNSTPNDSGPTLGAGFADSPADLADLPYGVNDVQRLRTVMSLSWSGKARDSLMHTRRALDLYDRLGEGTMNDGKLKKQLVEWLSRQRNEFGDDRCLELYHSVPSNERTLPVYTAASRVLMRRKDFASVSQLHQEALETIENGHELSRLLFRRAIQTKQWELAVKTEADHRAKYAALDQNTQSRVFWLHVSEIPKLLESALRLLEHLQSSHGALGNLDQGTRIFCAQFFKTAILQEFSRQEGSPLIRILSKGEGPRMKLRSMFRLIADVGEDAPQFFRDALTAMLHPRSNVEYAKLHHVVSYVYAKYCQMPGVVPSQRLLMRWLERLTEYANTLQVLHSTHLSMSITELGKQWDHYHGQVSIEAVKHIMKFYARSGKVSDLEHWYDYLCATYPDYRVQKDILFTKIWIHARRAELDKAQQAFAEIRRTAAEHGEEPELRCWNMLLLAHSLADDLGGGLTNLQNIIEYAKLEPDADSFQSILHMLARRGDVEGTEDILDQYDRLVKQPRRTGHYASLLTAHVGNGDVLKAEEILRGIIPRVRAGEVLGSLTKCFNIIMTAHSAARDVDATMRTYRWMREEEVSMNADSYGALIQVLSYYRQPDAAYRVLRFVMKNNDVKPTAFHYALIINGFVNANRPDDALKVHQEMEGRNVRSTISTQVAYLKAKAIQERRSMRESATQEPGTEPVALERTIEDLKQHMQRNDGSEVASKQPMPGLYHDYQADANPARYFDFLILIHGQHRCFEAVRELFRRYKETLESRGIVQDAPPIRLLASLMSAHLHAGEHEEVEECWKLAKEQADLNAPVVAIPMLRSFPEEDQTDALDLSPEKLQLDDPPENPQEIPSEQPRHPQQSLLQDKQAPQPRRPAPRRRYVLSRALRYYVQSLASQSRVGDAIATVSGLLKQGYSFDNFTWNTFIKMLTSTSPPLALLAFVLTERFLIPQFPGWTFRTRYRLKPQAKAEGLQHIRTRYLRYGQLMPRYDTLVQLGASLLEIRRVETLGRRGFDSNISPELEKYVGTLRQIRERAPKTLFAVQSMPRVEDRMQSSLLRREAA